MASIDDMHGLVAGQGGAKGKPHPNSVAGAELWTVAGTLGNGTGFVVYLDPQGVYWSLTDGSAYVVERGVGSVALSDAMRRKRIIV